VRVGSHTILLSICETFDYYCDMGCPILFRFDAKIGPMGICKTGKLLLPVSLLVLLMNKTVGSTSVANRDGSTDHKQHSSLIIRRVEGQV
jgi:hypothetical protein